MLPASIASYRIVRQLGEGGMGVVYEAVHETLGRHAAIKVLHPEFSQNAQIRARFFNEARAVNMVQHPGLVSIYEFGESPDGSTYLIMEFLAGDSLRKRIKQHGGPMPVAQVLRLSRQMASALAAAHQKKIVHRDLKPDNVMLVADSDVVGGERAKLLDFGIAKVAEDPKNPGIGVKTRTGMMMGTPAYMAPEQCRGAGEVDERADVYSLGVMFYEMLTGRPPFTDSAPGELIARHLFEQPPPIQSLAPSVPAEVATLVHRMLAKRPDERPSMPEIVQQLERLPSWGEPLGSSVPAASIPRTLPEGSYAGPGTLTQAPSQSSELRSATNDPNRRKKTLLASGVFGAVLVSGALAFVLIKRAPETAGRTPPPAPAIPSTAVPAVPMGSDNTAAAGSGNAAVQPAKTRVKWIIRSTPPGATVVKASNHSLMGQTPWTVDLAAEPGEEKLLLRLVGYEEATIDVPRDRDTDFHIEMSRIEETPVPAPNKPSSAPIPMKTAEPTVALRPKASLPKPMEVPAKPASAAPDKRTPGTGPGKGTQTPQNSGKTNKSHDDFELLD